MHMYVEIYVWVCMHVFQEHFVFVGISIIFSVYVITGPVLLYIAFICEHAATQTTSSHAVQLYCMFHDCYRNSKNKINSHMMGIYSCNRHTHTHT